MYCRIVFLIALLLCAPGAQAFSSGSTVCEVNALPFTPMAGVLRQPAPAGWQLQIEGDAWHPGALRRLSLRHPDPDRRARGVLVWIKGNSFGTPVGAGRFLDLGVGDLYQFSTASPPEDCAEWSLTHRDATPKTQSQMLFAWQAPATSGLGILAARAFVIEDCSAFTGGCRDAQALTEIVALREALFAEGFE